VHTGTARLEVRTSDDLVAEAAAALVEDYDLSQLDGRTTEQRPPEPSRARSRPRLPQVPTAVDFGTGDGETWPSCHTGLST